MTSEDQLREWVLGNSLHNNDVFVDVLDKKGNVLERQYGEGGECCPDFSCCRPDLKWPEEQRRIFAENEHLRMGMLMMALGSLLSGESAYVAGFQEA